MKKRISILLLIVFIVSILPVNQFVFASVQYPPKNLKVTRVDGKPSIGYSNVPGEQGYYVNIEWEPPEGGFPTGGDVDAGRYQIYYKKNGESPVLYKDDMPSSSTKCTIPKLSSGSIYHIYMRAAHTHYMGAVVDETHYSDYSNEAIILTGLDVKVKPAGLEEIEIVWDDVKIDGKRIPYRVYISESSDFSKTSPIEVLPWDIGDNKAVRPIEDNKLSYIARKNTPATVYYVKVEPIVKDERIVVCEESRIGIGYTYIPAAMTRVSSGTEADVWKMSWGRVTMSVAGTETPTYTVWRKAVPDGLWESIGGQTDIERKLLITHGDEDKFIYKVRVYIPNVVDEKGNEIYIESRELRPQASEVPYNPVVPELQHSINENEEEFMEINKDSIKILWYIPKNSKGERDDSVVYDMWITTNPKDLDDDTILPTISEFHPTKENFVYQKIGETLTEDVVAYKYTISALQPNTIYYVKIIAKKKFPKILDGETKLVEYKSKSYTEIILTDSDAINPPTAPAKPPFALKKDAGGKYYITNDSAIVEWYTRWEEYKVEDDNGNVQWFPITSKNQGSISEDEKRTIQYDSDIKFGIGYMELTDDMTEYDIIRDMPLQIRDIPNPYADDENGSIEYNITGLNPNTVYIAWLRAYRDDNTMSDPSNPIVITTDPDYTIPLEKPEVPRWLECKPLKNNKGIELAWDRSKERYGLKYTYFLKWGTVDDITKTSNEVEIPVEYFDTNNVYTVTGLESDSKYYFWIRVEIERDEDEKKSSDWSDSKLIITTEHEAPDIPLGFGLKNCKDSVGKNHIYYEWNKKEGLDYILEISTNADYEDSQKIEISGKWEYKVENLLSNQIYYARLYAVDPSTSLISEPTHTIKVRTLQSDDEYDTSDDNEHVIDGDIIEDSYDKRTHEWTRTITGINADRFLEMIYKDKFIDYIIDLSNNSSKHKNIKIRKLSIDYKVLSALSQVKENLIIDIGDNGKYTVRPFMLQEKELYKYFNSNDAVIIDFIFDESVDPYYMQARNMYPIKFVDISIKAHSGRQRTYVDDLNKGLKITMPYDEDLWYYTDVVKAALYNERISNSSFKYLPAEFLTNDKDEHLALFETPKTGIVGILVENENSRFYDINNHWAKEDIDTIFSQHNIKSIEDSQTLFYPDADITVEDCMKLFLDVLEQPYDYDCLEKAKKAGLMKLVKSNDFVSRQEVVASLMRLYEIKTGERAISDVPITQFKDADNISPQYKGILQFAVGKGIVIGKSQNRLCPNEYVTRAEVVAMLRRMLSSAGEL